MQKYDELTLPHPATVYTVSAKFLLRIFGEIGRQIGLTHSVNETERPNRSKAISFSWAREFGW